MKLRVLQAMVLMTLGAAGTTVGSGCVAAAVVVGAAAGAATYAYVDGELKSTFDADLDRTWKAAQRAVTDLEFAVKDSAKDATSARLTARKADGREVSIKVERETDKATKVRVRVGTFGDEADSRLIMDSIKSHL